MILYKKKEYPGAARILILWSFLLYGNTLKVFASECTFTKNNYLGNYQLNFNRPVTNEIIDKKGAYFCFSYSMGVRENDYYHRFNFNPQARFHDNIGVNWNFGFVNFSDSSIQIHSTGALGFYLGKIIINGSPLSTGSAQGAMLLTLLLAALPDGITGHFNFANKIEFSPYVNFLGLDFTREFHWPHYVGLYNISGGLKSTFSLNPNLGISLIVESRKTVFYSWNYNLGIGINLKLE